MHKKILAVLLSAFMIAGTAIGCGSEEGADSGKENNAGVSSENQNGKEGEEAPTEVTVSTVYGDVTVPYSPERICVLDLSTMDIVDALDLADQVVCLQWHKHYPSYLEEYYNSETIISITSGNGNHGGFSESTETEEETDPYEAYYGIDADIIIGTTEKITEDLYAVLSQIAPTVVLETASTSENLYAAVLGNAATIASIWGKDETFESMIAPYDEIYQNLCSEVNGKSFVMTTGNTDLSSIVPSFTVTGESSGKKKNNTANMINFLTQMGMVNITDDVSADLTSDALTAEVEAGTSVEDVANTVINEINTVEPTAVFIFNYSYNNLEEIRDAEFDLLGLDDLLCPYFFTSVEMTYATGGLTAVTGILSQMAEGLLK